MAAISPEKSRTLHNFSLPPRLNWGAQRLLRCSKANSTADEDDRHQRRHLRSLHYHPYNGSFSSSRRRRDPADPNREDERIEVVREKLMIDLQTEVDKIKIAILGEGGEGESAPRQAPVAAEERPWNLRTRRAACRDPNANGAGVGGGKGMRGDEVKPGFSPPVVALPRESGGGADGFGEKRERVKFSVSLSRQEIEEDFMELTRRRPARKPKKRSKYVQKQLDTLFPGLWLSEITADIYKVNENPEPGKG